MSHTLTDAAILGGSLAGGTLVAELAGAANMGVALTFGELAFMAALLWTLLLRR